MKKIALTSLLAVFAVSGAHAANIIDGNPLYMPKAGHFYSVSSLGSHSEATRNYALTEEFGYGVTNKLTVDVSATLTEAVEDFPGGEDELFDSYGLTNLSLKATYRAFDKNGAVADVYGGYAAGSYGRGGLIVHSDFADDSSWFDKDLIDYTWSAGTRLGYTTGALTLAGHVEYNYMNTESFNWDEPGYGMTNHALKLGLDAQYLIDKSWNLVAGAEYKGYFDDEADNSGVWGGYFGVNYNIDRTKFVGAYISGSLNHHDGDKVDEWGWNDGFGFGAKFGIDF